MTERERRRNAIQTFQNDLHTMQLRESQLRAQIREKVTLEKSMDDMRQEIATLTVQGKVSKKRHLPFSAEFFSVCTGTRYLD